MLSGALHSQPILKSCSPGPGIYRGVYGSLKVSLLGDFSCVSIVPKFHLFTADNWANFYLIGASHHEIHYSDFTLKSSYPF